jgi:hypothetical protein
VIVGVDPDKTVTGTAIAENGTDDGILDKEITTYPLPTYV